MEDKWVDTEISVETVNWRGKPVTITGVRAILNEASGKTLVRPYELAQAEIANIAKKYGLEARDIATTLMIYAKPGPFKGGEIFFKYHLQKMLFYLWKEITSFGYYESMPRDEFIAAKNGPVPAHINEDLERLSNEGLISIKEEYRNPNAEHASKRILLTDKGSALVEKIWEEIPIPYRKVSLDVKMRLHPMVPENIRKIVHMEYPEYIDTYIENDIE